MTVLDSQIRQISSKSEEEISPLAWIQAHPGEIYYGSKSWANYKLRHGIKLLKDDERDEKATKLEVIMYIRMLQDAGFWWQAKRVRNFLNRRRSLRLLGRPAREATAERREAGLQ